MFLDRGLGADPGVVHARQPEDFEALHPGAAREDVLDRVVQDVTECQHAGNVGRRNDDGERRLARLWIGFKIAIVDPTRVPFGLDRFRVVSF